MSSSARLTSDPLSEANLAHLDEEKKHRLSEGNLAMHARLSAVKHKMLLDMWDKHDKIASIYEEHHHETRLVDVFCRRPGLKEIAELLAKHAERMGLCTWGQLGSFCEQTIKEAGAKKI